MRRLSPTQIALVVAAIVILALTILLLKERLADRAAGRDNGEESASADPVGKADDPAGRCASQATYDRIKLGLFRSAARTRGSGGADFDRLAAYASARVERPRMTGLDESLGTVRCSGHLSIDLPPGTAVVGGRRTLAADVDYILQPSADGSGDIVLLEGADPIIVPLATVARSGSPAPTVAPPEPASAAAPEDEPVETPDAAATEPRAEQPERVPEPREARARPSFNCRYARTRSEIAVCREPRLAELDRAMAAEFYRALSAADAAQRRRLTATRDDFLRYRDRCSSDSCIADAYRGRVREIRDIMR